MSNINCAVASCVYMNDGKCALKTVMRASPIKTTANPTMCPYYKNTTQDRL